ncbi:hypothetical protein H6P81_016286 [Aristolochia fimbriata]|uniref:Reverse transcriptase domain-containing protein n=1 Tax=Aristolochia fimbriata TaxID=158543 RepID=A0AAV7EAY5_ARIFI|nr:hypothetical protein H6P81_016286 [Aristolochia fimbriata]
MARAGGNLTKEKIHAKPPITLPVLTPEHEKLRNEGQRINQGRLGLDYEKQKPIKIYTSQTKPIKITRKVSADQSQRRFRPELVPKIEKEVDKLIAVNFIREVKCPSWIANIVPVKKKTGQIRVCVDFRDLNKACPKDDFPLPISELMVDATTGHEALSFMDGSSGYNQIRMDPKDEDLTAFCTPKGIFCYKVMPFGLKNAGATYQRAMQNIFDDFLHK